METKGQTPGAKINELLDEVDRLSKLNASQLESRDRLWCLALIAALKIDEIQAVLARFNELKSMPSVVSDSLQKQAEVLSQLKKRVKGS